MELLHFIYLFYFNLSRLLLLITPAHQRLFHVLQQILEACVCFLSAGLDLVSWEDEAVFASVPKLRSKGVVGSDNIIHIVNAGAGGLVDGRADGAVGKRRSMDGLDGGNGALCEGLQLVIVGGDGAAGISIGWKSRLVLISGNHQAILLLTSHEELRVGVIVDI